MGKNVYILWGAVLRGDQGDIIVKDGSNIQDNCVLHSGPSHPLILEENVTVGHGAVVHGATIGAGSIVGMNSTVLNGAVVGKGCIIGANALVPEGMKIPDYSLVVGCPAKVVKTDIAIRDKAILNAMVYSHLREKHLKELELTKLASRL